ncbi:N-acetylmuramidase family protein [Salmonella enterica]|nr:N-acetylmuramidase family protein [Salmonella enterica]
MSGIKLAGRRSSLQPDSYRLSPVRYRQFVPWSRYGWLSPSGRPKILFEGHIFWRELAKRRNQPEILAASFPSIIYRQWTAQHYLGGEKEHARLETAMSFHREAALYSTSCGAFQIMGFNFALCGFHSVEDFVAAQSRGNHGQLEAFCQFMATNNLNFYLQNKDWVSFAKRYHGPGYAQNRYDLRIADAYQRYLQTQLMSWWDI